jgi:tRNA dimethylallyltransferase
MSYSAGEFLRDAAEAMREIWARGRQPLLVGGTMLYFHALSAGLAELPRADAHIRGEIDEQAAAGGWKSLHQELARVDPEAAARIHVNDPQRIQRALEVYRATGFPITHLQRNRGTLFEGVQVLEFAAAPGDRMDLHRRIAGRFDAMMASGFLDEVRLLYERTDLTAEHPSMRAVGYRQAWTYLAGRCGLDEFREKAVAATRQLAKRQLTWLRRRHSATWINSVQPHAASMVMDALSECGFAGWPYV